MARNRLVPIGAEVENLKEVIGDHRAGSRASKIELPSRRWTCLGIETLEERELLSVSPNKFAAPVASPPILSSRLAPHYRSPPPRFSPDTGGVTVPLAIINQMETPLDDEATLVLHQPLGKTLWEAVS